MNRLRQRRPTEIADTLADHPYIKNLDKNELRPSLFASDTVPGSTSESTQKGSRESQESGSSGFHSQTELNQNNQGPAKRQNKQKVSTTSSGSDDVFRPDNPYDNNLDEPSEQLWDIAKIVPRERVSSSESFKGFLKFLRLFMYAAILIVVLIFATCNVVTILFLEAALVPKFRNESLPAMPHKQDIQLYRAVAINQLVWILCFPHLFQFVISFFKVLFGNENQLSAKIVFGMLLCEFLHTAGLTILVFKVLPYFGSFYALGLMNSVYLVPVTLKVFFGTSSSPPVRRVVFKVMDIIVMFVSLAMVIALPLVAVNNHFGQFWWPSVGEKYGSKREGQHSQHIWWQIPVSLIFVSVKWWENFVGTNRQCLQLWDIKKCVHESRNKVNVFSTIFNVGLIIGFVFLLEYLDNPDFSLNNILNPVISKYECPKHLPSMSEVTTQSQDLNYTTETPFATTTPTLPPKPPCEKVTNYLQSYTPAIINIASSLIVYYCCGLAAKLLMQPVSFLIPILLTTPVVIVIMLLQCLDIVPVFPKLADYRYEFLCDISFVGYDWFNWVSVLSWMCLMYTNRHMWTPSAERLSRNESLFITPLYTGGLLTQCLLMNRRNDDQDKNLNMGGNENPEIEQLYRRINGKNMPKDKNADADPVPITPMIYACATMWHETNNEMIQILKSIYRMDKDQGTRRMTRKVLKIYDPDYYEFEAHIFFDDAMELNDDDKWIPNSFVISFKDNMREAASAITEVDDEIKPPYRVPTPYGGRLVWQLPYGNKLVIHLKDKNKIRHRKRWSQVMYMYYLLGYKLFDEVPDDVARELHLNSTSSPSSQTDRKQSTADLGKWVQQKFTNKGFLNSDTFRNMEDRLIQKAENTFILALDGDVDFKPNAVKLLLDRMRINNKTGAACGRIHPIGSSPVVWYQSFEYSVGHWFQKSTEHVLGCVLCSPGCFSLFRGSALLDDNVMKRYTTEPTEPIHFLQYDQGEDRWLCTLLLQKGYRVDYTAASDALTYAPETFDEFFNQRRRWTPSTIANIIDLLSDSKNTMLANANISFLYVLYQFFLMISTILGPATIVMAIASALETVFDLTLLQSYSISLAPVVIYIVICLYMKTKYQLLVGAFLSVMYAAVMMVVLVGILESIVVNYILDPSLFFLIVVTGCFVFAGLLHPYEFSTLIHGILYFLCIPAGYLVLMIYSICNLHNVSWGTREVPQRKSKKQLAAAKIQEEHQAKTQKKKGIFSLFRIDVFMDSLKEMLTQIFTIANKGNESAKLQRETVKEIMSVKKELKKLVKIMSNQNRNPHISDSSDSEIEKNRDKVQKKSNDETLYDEEPLKEEIIDASMELDDEENPNWIKHPKLGKGKIYRISKHETQFWKDLIEKYLKPIKKDVQKEKQLAQNMILLRNNASFAFWFLNLLWVLFNFMIQRNEVLNRIKIGNLETQPLGFIFLIFFLLILLLQMIGMIIHRWGTLLQLISITEIKKPIQVMDGERPGKIKKFMTKEGYKLAEDLMKQTHDDIYEDLDDIKFELENAQNESRLLNNNPHTNERGDKENEFNVEALIQENQKKRERNKSHNLRRNFERQISHYRPNYKPKTRGKNREMETIPESPAPLPSHMRDQNEVRFRRKLKRLSSRIQGVQ